MAKYFNLITVDTPTGLTATPQAGGSLPVGTTYYYRVVAFRRFEPVSATILPIFSAPTEEVSAATDSTNRTIYISWNTVTNAYGYIIQRTTTPGYYPVGGQNTFTVSSGYVVATTLNYLTDDGTKLWAQNPDFTEACPVTEVYSDNNDTIALYEILDAAIANGWTHIRTPFPAGIVNTINTNLKLCLPLFFNGGLYLRNCKFNWDGPIIIFNSSFHSANTVEYVPRSYSFAPMLFTYGVFWIGITTDNSTLSTTIYCYNNIKGSGSLVNFVTRHLIPVIQTYFYYSRVMYLPFSANIELVAGDIGNRVQNSLTIDSNHAMTGMHFGDVTISGDQIGPSNVYGNIRMGDNIFVANLRFFSTGTRLFYVCCYPCSALVDPYFHGGFYQSQIHYYPDFGYNNTNCIMFTVTGRVSDKDGNPIANAKVYIYDSFWNSAIFENLNVTSTTKLNDTDDYSSYVVSDASQINVGDVLRIRSGTELLLVTNKVGNTLTVQRGYGGTYKRKSSRYYTSYIWRQKPYVLTDSNGEFIQVCTWVEMYPIVLGTSIYNTVRYLIDNGYMGEVFYTPHTLRIEADGYATYEDKITVDKRLDLEIALSPPGGGGTMTITEHAHAVC